MQEKINNQLSGAEFSDCGRYRYKLWRIWDNSRPLAMCIGLNPSTANADKNDNTINILIRVLGKLGYGGFYMMNLFAWISSKPEDLLTCEDPLGENDSKLKEVSLLCSDVIVCWGAFDQAEERIKQVLPQYPKAKCFGYNKNGTPFHPRALSYKGMLSSPRLEDYKRRVMYDSDEAAQKKTVVGWVSRAHDGYREHFHGDDEHQARWSGCTHKKCECGEVVPKSHLKCDNCYAKQRREEYLKMPFKEWNLTEPVNIPFDDKYFFDVESLEEYMLEQEVSEIDLLICEPVGYSEIDAEEVVGGDAHEEWEPSAELDRKIKEFNAYIGTLPPHSWYPGKVRTTYKSEEVAKELAES